MNRTGEVWAMGGSFFVCFGDDPEDPAKYEFQAVGSERKVKILKTSLDCVVDDSIGGPANNSSWWRKLS